MKYIISFVLLLSYSTLSLAVIESTDIMPALFLDFEYHGGILNEDNEAYFCRAPGVWASCGYAGSALPFSENTGVDGHDCLDKTSAAYWGATSGTLRYGSNAVGYDNELEYAIDKAYSITVCGWFKAISSKPIGGNARFFYRPGQIEILTPASPDNGKLAILLPANAGTNTSDILIKSQTNVYHQPNEWVFFAVSYDGTKTSDNVKFYKGSLTGKVELVSISTANAGQLLGGEHNDIVVTSGGPSAGVYGIAGYLDKFYVFADKTSHKGALDIKNLEKLRRQNVGLPKLITDGLPGDTDLDGDVDDEDIAIVNTNFNAGHIRDYYWQDGDFDGDLDIGQNDLNIANTNYTGNITSASIDVAVISNKTKIHLPSDVEIIPNPSAQLYAAGNEHEGFQIAILPKQYRIADVELTASQFTNESGNIFPQNKINIRRIETVRVDLSIENPWQDPLMEETAGTAIPGKVLLFWIDFDVPADIQPGRWTGSIFVNAPDRPSISIPVELNVWNFNIPIEQNLQTSFNLFRAELRNVYGGNWNTGDDPNYQKWLEFVLDYRVSPVDMSMYSNESSMNRFVKVTKKLNGTWEFDFSEFDKYLDFCIARGMGNFNMADLYWHFWKPFWGYDEATAQWKYFDNLLTKHYEEVFAAYMNQAKQHYSDNGPRPYNNKAFFYAYDELNPGDSTALQQLINRHDIVESLWPQLDTLTTSEPARYPSYENHLDVWVGKVANYITYTAPHVDRLRAKGNEIWLYVTGWNVPYCNLEIDEPGIEHRMLFWQTFLYKCEGFLHWGLNVWPHYRVPNPWNTDMPTAAEYDRWPNTDWDDAGWLSGWHSGGGYLIYPGLNGPLSSIRLEMVRDGIEDWEMLNMLGWQDDNSQWNGLIKRAQDQGVSQNIINQAIAAVDISTIVQSTTAYTHDAGLFENKRIEIGNAIEALVDALGSQKPCDLNGDGSLDLLDLEIIVDQWLLKGVNLDADLDVTGEIDFIDYAIFADCYNFTSQSIPEPGAYIPFENTNGVYGVGSTSNLAWNNITPEPDEQAAYIGGAASTWATVSGADGIKGNYLDITGSGTPNVDTFATFSYKFNIINLMSDAQSYTFTFWVNTRDVARLGSDAYILRQFGTYCPAVKWRADGRFQLLTRDNVWRYSNYDFSSNGDWQFVAITVNNASVRFYKGTKTQSVVLSSEITGLNLPAIPTLTSGSATATPFILAGYSYNLSDKYPGMDMDEFRVYTSKNDSSGALSLEQIESIRQYDISN